MVQPVILDYLASKMISSDDLVVVSPDVGGVARARAFAKKLSDAPLAIVDKRRHGHNISEVHLKQNLIPWFVSILMWRMFKNSSNGVKVHAVSFCVSWCQWLYWQVMNLIGDVQGKVAVMVDDMIDTAGMLEQVLLE
jgi:ribose-phosphate pyrophosphokinase